MTLNMHLHAVLCEPSTRLPRRADGHTAVALTRAEMEEYGSGGSAMSWLPKCAVWNHGWLESTVRRRSSWRDLRIARESACKRKRKSCGPYFV